MLDVTILISLKCLIVLELVQTTVNSLDRIDWKELHDFILVLLDSYGKGLLKLQV